MSREHGEEFDLDIWAKEYVSSGGRIIDGCDNSPTKGQVLQIIDDELKWVQCGICKSNDIKTLENSRLKCQQCGSISLNRSRMDEV